MTDSKKPSKSRGFSPDENKRRYQLHHQIRKDPDNKLIIITKDRTILADMYVTEFDDKVTALVKEFDYAIQTEVLKDESLNPIP